MNDKSILMVASYGGPYGGSFIPSLIAYDSIAKNLGFHTVYIFPSFVENYAWTEKIRQVADKLYFIPYNQYSIDNILRIRKICKEDNVKLIYSRMSGWDITARFAMPKLPMIWHMEMNLDLSNWKLKLKYFIKYRFFGGVNVKHISVSKNTMEAINSLGVRNKCVWIPNAINLNRLEKKAAISSHNPINLLCFAYQPYIKGFDLILDACEILNRESVNYILLASAQNKTYEYIVERYGNNKPEWLKLLEPTEEISSVYKQTDIMLSISRSEGFSYCLLEAIYSGLPFVYSDIVGTSWADDMQMGVKFKSCDVNSLVEAIKICSASSITQLKQQQNRELIDRKYSMTIWINKIENEIRKCL